MLNEHMDELRLVAEYLIEHEKLDAETFIRLIKDNAQQKAVEAADDNAAEGGKDDLTAEAQDGAAQSEKSDGEAACKSDSVNGDETESKA